MNLAQLTKKQRDAAFNQQSLDPGKNVIITSPTPTEGGQVNNPNVKVLSINTLTGAVVLAAGTGISLTPSGQTITIAGTVDTLLELTDAPASYAGQAGKALVVKITEDGLEFGDAGGGGSGAFDFGLITDLADIAQDWGTLT